MGQKHPNRIYVFVISRKVLGIFTLSKSFEFSATSSVGIKQLVKRVSDPLPPIPLKVQT